MHQKLPRGLPLEEAFRFWTDSKDLQELDVYKEYWWRLPILTADPPTPYEVMHSKWRTVRAPLEHAFLGKLRSGELVAIGLEIPVTAKSTRDVIPSELWELLQPDFQNSGASGAGLELIKIEVVAPDKLAASALSQTPAGMPSNPRLVLLSDDDGLLTMEGETLTFAGEIQQAILRQLVDALEQRRRLRTKEVLKHAGSNADTLAKAFSGSPHWQKLKQILRQENGYCWLETKPAPP